MIYSPIIIFLFVILFLPPVEKPTEFDIPETFWEPLFFDAIDDRSKWGRLRESSVPVGGMEIRIWAGFGITGMEGYRLRRYGTNWSAYYLGPKIQHMRREIELDDKWEERWEKIEQLGILTLPDSSGLPNPVLVSDGVSYVIEINDGRTYRTYCYMNPNRKRWEEAQKLIQIVNIIDEEFFSTKR